MNIQKTTLPVPQEEALSAGGESLSPNDDRLQDLKRYAILIGVGWLGTGLATGTLDLPLKFVLKDQLHIPQDGMAMFFAMANIPIYLKPPFGILTDTIPLFGTRRRHYLLWSLLLGGVFWLLFGIVPRTFGALLWTYVLLNLFLVLTSTVLGGLMVEVGKRHGATGRLSAQRVGITRSVGLVTGFLGGYLATREFSLTTSLSAFLHFALVPLFFFFLYEPPTAQRNTQMLQEVWGQCRTLMRSGTLWSAAGLVFLVVVSPGFGTPLFYQQTNVWHFSKPFLGSLTFIGALMGMAGAILYGLVCRRWNLRVLLAFSILIHTVGTLLYLGYHTETSALIITAISGITGTLTILPLYDLAARATPIGSEALGYSVMMSVWNFTAAFSDVTGSKLAAHGWTFPHLVWLNAGTTIVVLLAVPLLPAALMRRREGEK